MEEVKRKIDFSTTLNQAIEIFKKTFLISGFAFLFLASMIVLLGIVGISFFTGFETIAEGLKTFDPTTLSLKGTLLYFGCMLLFTVLIAPFNAGLLKIMKDADDEQEISFSTFFSYVNSSYYGRIVLLAVILSTLNFGLNIGLQKAIPNKALGSTLSMIFTVLISLLTLLSLPNIIFKNLGVIEAIKDSISATKSNLLTILLLLIVAIAIGYAGLIAFCIGMFFTFPIYYAMQYCIYKNLN